MPKHSGDVRSVVAKGSGSPVGSWALHLYTGGKFLLLPVMQASPPITCPHSNAVPLATASMASGGACRGSEQQGPPPGSAHHLLPQPHRRAAERASLWRQHSNDQLQQEAQHWRHQAAAGQHGGRQLQPGHLPGHRGAAPDAGLCLHGEHCARRQPGKCAQLMCVASSSVHNAALRQHGRATAAQAGLTGALLWLIAAAPYECYYHIGAGGLSQLQG